MHRTETIHLHDIDNILNFWFDELEPEQRFQKAGVADREIEKRFADIHSRIAVEVPPSWREQGSGCLAAIIVLDQFSRNLYRDTARAFAADATALELAKYAISVGFDRDRDIAQRAFFYLPFEHSEAADDQSRSVELFATLGDERQLDYAVRHKAVVDRFGRFPHRNKALGRRSTAEEIEFINTPGTGF